MLSKAQGKFFRISPKKLRLVADIIRGKNAKEATGVLKFTNQKGAVILGKILKSAIANALSNEEEKIKQEDLFISKIMINEGPRMKRWRAISRGRAAPYMHRLANIVMELDRKQ
jgi:large subunit ribosomal protein L22